MDRREFLVTGGLVLGGLATADESAQLPEGVYPVWDLAKAHREATASRERVCLNGLWQWQPATENDTSVPRDHWGYFKVPGFWPGKAGYMQEDCQTLYAHPAWRDVSLSTIKAAWYQRELTVPAGWTDRRITLYAEYLSSLAFVDSHGGSAGAYPYQSASPGLHRRQARPVHEQGSHISSWRDGGQAIHHN